VADVIVLGGGIAGLAAAERLGSAGRSVVLVEARARLGGRIHTLYPSDFPHPIELGAEFIHGESPDIWSVIRRAGLAADEVPHIPARRHQSVQSPVLPMESLVDQILGPDPERAADRPFTDLLQDRLKAGLSQAEAEAALNFVEGFHAADPAKLGTRALADGGSAGRGKQFRLRDGYGGLVQWFARRLDGLPVELRLQAAASKVAWQKGAARVTLHSSMNQADEIEAKQVIITLPLSLMKGNGHQAAGLAVQPMPPGWLAGFDKLHIGTVRRIGMRFDRVWWDSGPTAPNFVYNLGQPFPVWWTATPPGTAMITGWVGGPASEAFSGQPKDRVVESALLSLAAAFGAGVDQLRRWLKDAFTHDWAFDPYTAGAYCYGGVGSLEAQAALARPVADTLFLAGEAFANQGGIGTVHGALSSGCRAAAAVLQSAH
jgi:monoamine oxidase